MSLRRYNSIIISKKILGFLVYSGGIVRIMKIIPNYLFRIADYLFSNYFLFFNSTDLSNCVPQV
jgi:hypothetical protein